LFGYFPGQIPPVVVVTLQDPDIPMAGEALHGPAKGVILSPHPNHYPPTKTVEIKLHLKRQSMR
jgi:hypothetical protein